MYWSRRYIMLNVAMPFLHFNRAYGCATTTVQMRVVQNISQGVASRTVIDQGITRKNYCCSLAPMSFNSTRFNTVQRRCISTSSPRYDESVEDLGPTIKRPRRYLDMKTFRKFLQQQKTLDIEKEKRAIAQAHAKPPPDGWGILEFLNAAGIDDGADMIAESFGSWNEFISSTIEDLYTNNSMTNKQRRIIFKHITLYNHGMWPQSEETDYIKAFQAKPLDNEGKPWEPEDDAELKRLAEYYDADFGDPWLYISWDMQRTIEDVQERYIQLVIIPKYRNDKCEIAITKANKPLLMNRKFKLDPPFLYIIPSKEVFQLTPIYRDSKDRNPVNAKDVFSKRFQQYRRKECFEN